VISVEEARERILALVSPTAAETVALPEAWGRVLAAPVRARLTQPPADMSAMDGYAVRAADAAQGARLRVIGAAPAGHPFAGDLGPGQAVRIFTGAPVPPGADAILLQEDAVEADGWVTPNEAPRPGRWIRRCGLDFSQDQDLLPASRRLTARDVGLAAAANHPWLTVHRRPRVAILATGDEIALPGEPLPPGGIVSSNSHALAALVRAGGGEPLVLPVAPDDAAAIAAAGQAAQAADLLLTTGGASVGEHDLVRAGLAAQGMALDFWRIAMRPGKPLMAGRVGRSALVGLPGNPVSALVCAVLFVLPALDRMSGLAGAAPPTMRARLGTAVPQNDRRADHLRATLLPGADGMPVATPHPVQDSSMLAVLAAADALVLRAPHAPALPAGAEVDVIRLAALGV
jgi:molybdopterin molybdotransferase